MASDPSMASLLNCLGHSKETESRERLQKLPELQRSAIPPRPPVHVQDPQAVLKRRVKRTQPSLHHLRIRKQLLFSGLYTQAPPSEQTEQQQRHHVKLPFHLPPLRSSKPPQTVVSTTSVPGRPFPIKNRRALGNPSKVQICHHSKDDYPMISDGGVLSVLNDLKKFQDLIKELTICACHHYLSDHVLMSDGPDLSFFENALKLHYSEYKEALAIQQETHLGLLLVDKTQLKEKLVSSSHCCLEIINKMLSKLFKRKVDAVIAEACDAQFKLEFRPTTTTELANYLTFLDEIIMLEAEHETASQMYKLINMYSVPIPSEDHDPQILDINADPSKVSLLLAEVQILTDELQAEAFTYTSYQKIFKIQVTKFDMLEDLLSELGLKKLLWKYQEEWDSFQSGWRLNTLEKLDLEGYSSEILKFSKYVNQLEKGLPSNSVVTSLKNKVEVTKQRLLVITDLHNSCMKPEHWKTLESIVGTSLNAEELTLAAMEETDVFSYGKEIQEFIHGVVPSDPLPPLQRQVYKSINVHMD
ncbi:dynein heavy chain 6, axonemal-like [Cheilinus undulatus]|uniref:dynein heavy chain 6, axonemal-like n=1 Tax=Cheilinus undulatus TaxID=241271 RepID=UPI001BD4AFAB|nr:dynein heavy chain 6, axonemal-like [Cheilinus undulatus]